MIVLNEGQERAKSELLATINSTSITDDNRFHTLSGCAGSGKSTLLANLLKEIPVSKTIGITTPTHKSLKVIDDMIAENNMSGRVDVRTIHSALGLKLVQRGEQEVIEKDPRGRERIYDILIVDEASMLDDELLLYILESKSRIVIFVGDECQISPVNSAYGEISKVFDPEDVPKQSKLTEVVRCALDNPIIKLATKFRLAQYEFPSLPIIKSDRDSDGNGIHMLSSDMFVDLLFDKINSEQGRSDIDYVRCVAYTNECVNNINRYIRRRKYGQNVAEFVEGEVVIAQESKGDMFTQVYRNSEELEILSVQKDICTEHIDDGIPCYVLELRKLSDDDVCTVKVVSEEGLSSFQHLLQTYADRARADKASAGMNWKKFWDIKKDFNTFKHVYCMTAHKSQGSTFDNTFIYLPDFLQWGISLEVLQLLYTAITRSRYKTFFTE